MDKFKEKIVAYLEKKTHGALLVDDLWGVGKTYNIKKITSTIDSKENIKNVKYYCYLNIDEFSKNDLKTYIIDNSKVFNSDDYVNLYVELSTKKMKFNILKKINFLKLGKIKTQIPEKIRDFSKVLFEGINNLITLLCSAFFGIKNPISILFKGYDNWKAIAYKEIKLDETIVLIIDEIERKSDSLSLKDMFTKLIKLQENNDIKIILIMNSVELSSIDKLILNDWKDKLVHSTLNLNYAYDEYLQNEEIEDIKVKIQLFENLTIIFSDHIINTIIRENINFKNFRILKRLDKLAGEILSIESKLLKKYDEKLNEKKVKNHAVKDFEKVKLDLILMALRYLNNMNLDDERKNVQSYDDYETIEKYFKSDYENLEERLEIVFTMYTDDVFHLERFYIKYLDENPNIKNKIISGKPKKVNIFFEKNTIHDLFSSTSYNPTFEMIEGLQYIIMSNDSEDIKAINNSLVNILERIFEIKKIEIIFELNEFNRITDVSYYLDMIINQLEFQKCEYKKIISILNGLRNDVFVRSLQKRYSNMFFEFKYIVDSQYLNRLSIFDSPDVIEYMMLNNSNMNIITEIVDSCVFNNISFLHGFLKCIEINYDYMRKQMIENIDLHYYGDVIENVIDEINTNEDNHIIEYINIKADYSVIKKEKEARENMFNFNGTLVRFSMSTNESEQELDDGETD